MAKVLLVEDDNNLREIYQARLTAEGYDIVAAQNGEEALVVAKQNKPDLIISDVMMPRISGFEMLDILRNTEQLKHTKVIMLTALGQAEDQKRADTLGADKYLVKSQVTLEDIVNAAKELLGEVDGSSPITAVPPAPEPAQTPAPQATPTAVAEPVAPVAQAEPVTTAPTDTNVASTPAPMSVTEPTQTTPVVTNPIVVAPTVITPTAPPVIPTPTQKVPAPVEPSVVVPAPAVMPVAEEPAQAESAPAAVSMPNLVEPVVPAPNSTAATDAAQTLEAEEAALQAQISNYAQAAAEPALAVEPTPNLVEPVVVPEPTTEPSVVVPVIPTQTTSNEAANDAAIAQAVQALNSPQAAPATQPPSVANAPALAVEPTPNLVEPVVVPEPTPVATPAKPVAITTEPVTPTPLPNGGIAGKKIIQPITDAVPKPSLDELLAKEASMAAPAAGTPVINGTSSPENTGIVPTAHAPGDSFDPNVAL